MKVLYQNIDKIILFLLNFLKLFLHCRSNSMDGSSDDGETLPETGFAVFSQEWRQKYKEATQSLTYLEVARKIAAAWSKLDMHSKSQYYDQSNQRLSYRETEKKRRINTIKSSQSYDKIRKGKKRGPKHVTNFSQVAEEDSDDFYETTISSRRARARNTKNEDAYEPKYGKTEKRKYSRRNRSDD